MRVRYVGPSPARRLDRDLHGVSGTFARDEWKDLPTGAPADVLAFLEAAWDWEVESGDAPHSTAGPAEVVSDR